ncbi:MAG: glycosyltransferase family 4 protein [Bacteroidales bacterium]|nr:glycosyltransferase family 4 protein [Bacteroidales bacterium]
MTNLGEYSMNKRVASIVLNSFTNDSRVLKEAMSLINFGFFVEVVALHEPGLSVSEINREVHVKRMVLRTRPWPRKAFFQVFKYIEFLYKTVFLYKSFDIIHCHDLGTLPVGVLIKLLFNRKVRLVYDAHEHETERSYNQNPWLKKIKRFTERRLIRYTDEVITVSESIATDYQRLYKISKPVLIYNCPRYAKPRKGNLFREMFAIPANTEIFLYQGAFGYGRGIEVIIDTFIELTDRAVVFLGYGEMSDKIIKASELHSNIFYHKAVDYEILQSFTSSADWGLVYIENVSLSYNYCLPNKLFEYIFAGLPVIVTPLKELSDFVNTYSVGIISDGFTPDDLMKAIQKTKWVNKNDYTNHFEEVLQKYNWEEQEKKLKQIYGGL